MYFEEKLEKFKDSFDSKFSKLKSKVFLIERWLLFKYEFLKRGFSQEDLWNLDMTITEFILPRLKEYKEIFGKSNEDWDKKLGIMIDAFELLSHKGDVVCYSEEESKKITKGLNCFAKYYQGLWY